MQKLTIEERTLFALERISRSISSLESTFERLYQDWKFPVGTMAEQMAPQWKEEREENRVERQLDLLRKTMVIAVAGLVITALVGVVDILIRVFLNK